MPLAPLTSSRRTLNEVLLEELKCLRPADATAAAAPKRPAAATFAASEADQRDNLAAIYSYIGNLPNQDAKGPNTANRLAALCLSGGGIRSATFNLGVLQGLARVGLLDEVDYLSSVSGGGYIASWLRAWMHRRGVDHVTAALGGRDAVPDQPSKEPTPVANLRDYSNYLTPKLGLFSGDTWSLVATVARNLLLNWLILLPLLGVVVGIPLLFLLFIRTSGLPAGLPRDLLGLAVLIEVLASVLVYHARRFAKDPSLPQGYFIVRCVLPVCLAAAALSAAGIGLPRPWDRPTLWAFAGIWSIAVPLLGWTIVEIIARWMPAAKKRAAGGKDAAAPPDLASVRQVDAGLEVLALIVSGAVGASLFVGVVVWWFDFLYDHPALYVIFVFPVLLGLYLLSRAVFIGVASLNDERGDPTPGNAPPRSRISSNDSDREWWARLSGWVLLIIASWTAVTGICLIGSYLPNVIWSVSTLALHHRETVTHIVQAIVTVVGLLSGTTAALTASSGKTPSANNPDSVTPPPSAKRLLAIAGPVFLISLIMVLSWAVKGLAEVSIGPDNLFRLHFGWPGPKQPVAMVSTAEFLGLLGVLALVGVAAGRIANVNRFSLHGMYRNRLVRAYLGASNTPIDGVDQRVPDPFTGFSLTDNLPLHRLSSPPQGDSIERPLPIINTTLNLVHGDKLAWQQRKAESFSMTPLFCGTRSEGYRDSREYGGPGGITVGTAVTISGAAANPNMGYSSSPVLGFLMAIFNVRLGAWLGNTNSRGDKTCRYPGPRYAILSLFAEMFGLTNAKRRYVNLSDGGHFDNLGLYEVVMRRCRYVLVSDAGQDGSFSFEDLGNSIRKIRIDFGINITFDHIEILPNTAQKDGLYCAIGSIRYSDVDGTPRQEDGRLIYIKPTLRGRGTQIPYDIYSYSRESVTFPHETTVDQWFSESQFESYRALGSHIVAQVTESLEGKSEVSFEDFYNSVSLYVTPPPAARPAPGGNGMDGVSDDIRGVALPPLEGGREAGAPC